MPIVNSSKAFDHEVNNNKVIALFDPFALFLFYFLLLSFILSIHFYLYDSLHNTVKSFNW